MSVPARSLPNGWSWKRLGEIADLLSGGTPPKNKRTHWAGSVPWVSPKDMKRHRLDEVQDFISEEAACSFSRVVPAGSTFVVVRGMILAKDIPVCLATRPMAFNQDVKAIVPKAGIDGEYLSFAIAARKSALGMDIGTAAHGTRRISSAALERLEVPMPRDQAEQRRIARALCNVLKRCELEKTRVDRIRSLKTATMATLFREGLHGRASRESKIGSIPDGWRLERLADLLTEPIRNGHSAPESLVGTGVATFSLTAVTTRDFSPKNIKVTTADPQRVRDLWVRDGDIFVERANTREMVGLAALYRGPDDPAIFPDLLIRIRADRSKIQPEVLETWLLDDRCRSYFRGAARGTASSMPKIDQGTVLSTLVPVPPSDEQDEIVALVTRLDRRSSTSILRVASMNELFAKTLNSLVNGELRVSANGHA